MPAADLSPFGHSHTSHVNYAFLLLAITFLLQGSCYAATFPVLGGDHEGRRVVVSYDPSHKQFGPETGPDLLLVDRDGKTIAKFPELDADWSWSGERPEQAVYRADWSESGDLVYIVFQAGRLYSGFGVYRFADGKLSRVEIDALISTIHEKELFGPPPVSPNVAISRVVAWLSSATLLCAMERAGKTYYLAIALPKVGKPQLIHSFQLAEPTSEHP